MAGCYRESDLKHLSDNLKEETGCYTHLQSNFFDTIKHSMYTPSFQLISRLPTPHCHVSFQLRKSRKWWEEKGQTCQHKPQKLTKEHSEGY